MADPAAPGKGPAPTDPVDRGVHAAALAGLPECGTARQAEMLEIHPASVLWDLVLRAELPIGSAEVRRRWQEHARAVDLDGMRERLVKAEAIVTTTRESEHPAALIDDIDPAPVIFRRGAPVDPGVPSVAIIGTRQCTPTGRELSEELGYRLAGEGVVVVSGLALGVDGAAHRGALRAGRTAAIAVVGSGLDVVYPRGNADLWRKVGEVGTILSEAPLGARPEAWRFPARNRIIAALADVVVVVESKVTGGSMITIEEAMRRGRPVMAVPGSVRNPAAAGTNLLISEGCAPVCGVEDVLVALDLVTAGPGPRLLTEGGEAPDLGEEVLSTLDPLERRVLKTLGVEGVTLDGLAMGCAAAVGSVAAAVVKLEQRSLVTIVDGLVRRRLAPEFTGGGATNTGRDPIPSDG